MSADNRPKTVEYATEAVLAPNCGGAACHSSFGNNDNYVFDTVDGVRHAMQSLVELDSAGDARKSPVGAALITWITVPNPFGLNIGRMPYDRPMANADVTYLENWIGAGLIGAQCEPDPLHPKSCDYLTISTCDSSWNFATPLGECGMLPNTTPLTPDGVKAPNCQSGKCECSVGFGDCNDDSLPATTPDGCETKLDIDGNCGGCGLKCDADPANPTKKICRATVGKDKNGPVLTGLFSCQCPAGFDNCDPMASMPCMTMVSTDTNCGTCGTTCTAPQTCKPVTGVPGGFSCQ
jgi:hypothetical protein